MVIINFVIEALQFCLDYQTFVTSAQTLIQGRRMGFHSQQFPKPTNGCTRKLAVFCSF